MKDGTRLGSFVIERALASGGMGSVYLGMNDAGTRVAIKTVNTESTAQLISLRREIRALLKIEHPSIVRIVEHGLYEALPWFAMEFIPGASLRSYFDSSFQTRPLGTIPDTIGKLPTFEAPTEGAAMPVWPENRPEPEEQRALLGHIAKILRGLGFLHAEGIVHRDLKPENIVIRHSDGEPILVDFGIAAQAGGAREKLTKIGDAAGTPSYMAPEQARGLWTDARADLYSIGCMLFEVLTGRPPYVGTSTFEVISAHVFHEIPSLPDDVDPRLAGLVKRLLAKSPGERPGYAHEVAQEIEEILGVKSEDALAPKTYLYRPDLEGREGVMHACEEALGVLKTERGDAYLISGEKGGGKTRFAIELAHKVRVDPSLEVLLIEVARDASGRNPFVAMLMEIADLCREKGPEFTRVALGDEAGVLAKTYPELLELPGLGEVEIPPDLPRRFEMMRRTRAWMTAVSRVYVGRPVVVIVDELNSRYVKFLEFFRSLQLFDPSPILVFVTTDAGEAAIIDEFAQDHVIRLEKLDDEAMVRLVKSMLVVDEIPEAMAEFVAVRGQGNPAFVTEYVDLAVAHGLIARTTSGSWQISSDPEAWATLPTMSDVGAVMAARLRALPPESRELLELVAVVGTEVSMALLGELMGAFTNLEVLDPILSGEHLVARGGVLAFSDVLLRESLIEAMPVERKVGLHDDIAEAMARAGARVSPARARHLRAAGRRVEARELYLELATSARGRDTATAWESYRSYIDLEPPDSADCLDALDQYCILSKRLARFEEMERAARKGLDMALRLRDEGSEAEFLLHLVSAHATFHREGGDELLVRAEALARKVGRRGTLTRVYTQQGSRQAIAGQRTEAVLSYERAFELSKTEGVQVHLTAGVNYGAALVSVNRLEEALRVFESVAPEARREQFGYLEAYVVGNVAVITRDFHDDLEKALDLLKIAESKHAAVFDRIGTLAAKIEQITTLLRLGRFGEALALASEVNASPVLSQVGPTLAIRARTALFESLVGVGQVDAARESVADLLASESATRFRARAHLLLAGLERRCGDLAAAEHHLETTRQLENIDAENRYGLLIEGLLLGAARGRALPSRVPDLPEGASVGFPRDSHRRLLAAIEAQTQGRQLLHGESPQFVAAEMPTTP